MIQYLSSLKPQIKQKVLSFISVIPKPQIPIWESVARKLWDDHDFWAAIYLFDHMASVYGKEVARLAMERFSGIAPHLCGRGIPMDLRDDTNPAIYLLRDRTMPLHIDDKLWLRNGANAIEISSESPQVRTVHLFSHRPTHTGFDRLDDPGLTPIDWFAYQHFIGWARQTPVLTFVDIDQIDNHIPLEIANRTPLMTAELSFDSPIKHVCGPLSDGTFIITLQPQLPVFSDVCRLCAVDFDKIRRFQRDYPMLPCDIREIGALKKDILLTNIEQSLQGDCAISGDLFITCGGGMQNAEVRFIHADGSWYTKFIHQAPVIAIINSTFGPVSIDESGQAILWNDDKPLDDIHFDMKDLPKHFLDNMADVLCSVDWKNKYLYLTNMPPKSKLSGMLSELSSLCISPSGINKSFIRHILDDLAILGNGYIHFWHSRLGCIHPFWQLSESIAAAEDWRALLDMDSPSIEDDPRIRIWRQ